MVKPSYPEGRQRLLALLCVFVLSSIVVLPFLLPYRVFPIPSFYSEWLCFVLIALAGLVFLSREFWKQFAVPVTALYLICLIGAIGIQSLWIKHAYPSQALSPILYLFAAIIVAVLASWLRRNLGIARTIEIFAYFAMMAGVVQAFVAVAQYLDMPGLLDQWITVRNSNRVTGNTGQPNHFASHVLLAGIATFYLYAEKKLSLAISVVLIILFSLTTSWSSSRTAMIDTILLFALSAMSYWKTRGQAQLRFMAMAGTFLIFYVGIQLLWPMVVDTWGGLAGPTALERGFTHDLSPRIIEWRKSVHMFMEAPLFGVGIGEYAWNSFRLQALPEFAGTPNYNYELFHHSHNIFLNTLAELGLAGFLIVVTMLIHWCRNFFHVWTIPSSLFIVASLLILFIHSNLEYPLWYSYFLAIAAFLLGLGDQRDMKICFTPRMGQIAATAALVAIGITLVSTYNGFRQLASMNNTIFVSPSQAAETLFRISKNPLLGPWAESAMILHGQPQREVIREQIAVTTRGMHFRPVPPRVYKQTIYLIVNGQVNEAIELLYLAARVYPGYLPKYIDDLKTRSAPEVAALRRVAENLLICCSQGKI